MRWLPVSTGGFIRSYLEEHGEATITQLYRALREEKRRLEVKVGGYANLRNYIYWLSRLGLVELSREEPSGNPHLKQPRRYYRLTKRGRELPAYAAEWANPRRRLYPSSWKK